MERRNQEIRDWGTTLQVEKEILQDLREDFHELGGDEEAIQKNLKFQKVQLDCIDTCEQKLAKEVWKMENKQMLAVETFCKISLDAIKSKKPKNNTQKVFYEGSKTVLENLLTIIEDIKKKGY